MVWAARKRQCSRMRQILQVGRVWASWTSPSNRPITAVTLLVGMSRLVGVTVSPMSRVALSALTIERWAERAVAVAGTKAPVAGESVCGGRSLDLLVHLLDGGFYIGRACGVEHGSLKGCWAPVVRRRRSASMPRVHAMSAAMRASLRWR